MRIQSLALATTLTLLSSSALVTTTSHAQKGVTLQPSSSWAVKRINQGGDNGYCALARRFKDDVVLTLARNDKGEASLALDFSQAEFDTVRNYTVTMDPGAGAQRRFNIKPSSARAFVMRVGDDKAFLSAINKTGYLRVELDNENFHFNLADIDEGQVQLDACLAEAVMPAAGEETPVAAASGFSGGAQAGGGGAQSSALEALRGEQTRLEQRLSALERENETLRVQKAQAEEAASGAHMTPAPVVAEPLPAMQADTLAMDGLREQVRSLKSENEALTKMADAAKAEARDMKSPSAGGSTDGVKDVSLIELARENEHLKALVKEQGDTPALKAQIKDLSQQVSSLEQENLDIASRLDNARQTGAEQKNLERQLLTLSAENETLKLAQQEGQGIHQDGSALREEIGTLQSRNLELAAQIEALSAEKISFLEQMQSYRKQAELAQSTNAAHNDQGLLEQLRRELKLAEDANTAELADKERQIAALRKELDSVINDQSLRDLSDRQNEQTVAEEYTNRIVSLESENARLAAERDDLLKGQDALQSMQTRVNALEAEKASLETALNDASAKIGTIESDIQSRNQNIAAVTDLNARIAVLEEEIVEAEKQNKLLVADNAQMKVGTDKNLSSLNTLEQELADQKAENDTLKKSLETILAEKDNGAQALAGLLEENEALRQSAAEQSEDLGKLAGVSADFEKLRAEHAALLIELEELKGSNTAHETAAQVQIEEKDQTISSLRESIKTLETENIALKDAAAQTDETQLSFQTEREDMAALIETLRTENETVKLQLSEAQAALETHDPSQEERMAELEAENARLAEKLEERDVAYKQLASDMKALKTREKIVAAPVNLFKDDDAEAVRIKSLILNQEMENLRRQKQRDSANPLLHNASLQNAPSQSRDDGAAMRAQASAVRTGQDDMMAAASSLASTQDEQFAMADGLAQIEPVAGDEDVQAVVQKVIGQGGESEQHEESDPFVTEEGSAEELNEAQMHERMLKRELGAGSAHYVETTQGDEVSSTSAARFESAGETPIQQGYVYAPSIAIADILSGADITVPDNVALVEKFSGAERVAYQWRTDQNVFGSAHQMPISNMDEFDAKVRDYLSVTEQRCGGDFAIVPAMSEQVGQTRIDGYEIACVGAGVDSSASVAFFNVDGTFTILAHEAPTQSMESAMAARDKIVSSIAKG